MVDVELLDRHGRVVEVQEQHLAGGEHGRCLAMYARGIEKERGAGRAHQIVLARLEGSNVARRPVPRLAGRAMAAGDIGEMAGRHVGQVEGQLHFPGTRRRGTRGLHIPGVIVPAVKVGAGADRAPAPRLGEGIVGAEIGVQHRLQHGMKRQPDHCRVDGQRILDQHAPLLVLLVAAPGIEIGTRQHPAKGMLQSSQRIVGQQAGQFDHAVGAEGVENVRGAGHRHGHTGSIWGQGSGAPAPPGQRRPSRL